MKSLVIMAAIFAWSVLCNLVQQLILHRTHQIYGYKSHQKKKDTFLATSIVNDNHNTNLFMEVVYFKQILTDVIGIINYDVYHFNLLSFKSHIKSTLTITSTTVKSILSNLLSIPTNVKSILFILLSFQSHVKSILTITSTKSFDALIRRSITCDTSKIDSKINGVPGLCDATSKPTLTTICSCDIFLDTPPAAMRSIYYNYIKITSHQNIN
eukprot:462690_1